MQNSTFLMIFPCYYNPSVCLELGTMKVYHVYYITAQKYPPPPNNHPPPFSSTAAMASLCPPWTPCCWPERGYFNPMNGALAEDSKRSHIPSFTHPLDFFETVLASSMMSHLSEALPKRTTYSNFDAPPGFNRLDPMGKSYPLLLHTPDINDNDGWDINDDDGWHSRLPWLAAMEEALPILFQYCQERQGAGKVTGEASSVSVQGIRMFCFFICRKSHLSSLNLSRADDVQNANMWSVEKVNRMKTDLRF